MSYSKPFDTAVTREHIRVDETRPGRSYRIADFCARLERACDEIDRLREENEKLLRVRDAASRFYKSRAFLEDQKEVDWDFFDELGEALNRLTIAEGKSSG